LIVLGLTGSMGMGKSTTADMFKARAIPVFDADAAVHELYRGEAVTLIEAAFPGVVRNGAVDRGLLGAKVFNNPEALACLEAIVHPLVRGKRDVFLRNMEAQGHRIVVLDIPLLMETQAAEVDFILLVTAPESVQRERLLARPGMTNEKLTAILTRQMPDAEKRAKADFIIDTSLGLTAAEQAVDDILRKLQG